MSECSLATSGDCHLDRRFLRLEEFRRLACDRADQLYRVAHPDQFEQFLYVLIAHPDAAMRSRSADGSRGVGPVNSVTFVAQTHPARADRVGGTRSNHLSGVIPGGLHGTA